MANSRGTSIANQRALKGSRKAEPLHPGTVADPADTREPCPSCAALIFHATQLYVDADGEFFCDECQEDGGDH